MIGKKLVKGHVVKMSPGYHTNNPYYVEITDIGEDFIETSIPNEHKLLIRKGTVEWDYHIKRMTIVGTVLSHGHLLINQELK